MKGPRRNAEGAVLILRGRVWGIAPRLILSAKVFGQRAGSSFQRKDWVWALSVPHKTTVARTDDGVSVFLERGASLFLLGPFRRTTPTNSPLENPIMDGQWIFPFPKSIFRFLPNVIRADFMRNATRGIERLDCFRELMIKKSLSLSLSLSLSVCLDEDEGTMRLETATRYSAKCFTILQTPGPFSAPLSRLMMSATTKLSSIITIPHRPSFPEVLGIPFSERCAYFWRAATINELAIKNGHRPDRERFLNSISIPLADTAKI